jgi:hypothetical protein
VRPLLRTPSRGGAGMCTREALVQSRSRRCKRAVPSRGGADGWRPLQGRASVSTCRACACTRVCVSTTLSLSIASRKRSISASLRARSAAAASAALSRPCSCHAPRAALRRVLLRGVFVCLFVAGTGPPQLLSRAGEATLRADTEGCAGRVHRVQHDATGCNRLRPDATCCDRVTACCRRADAA